MAFCRCDVQGFRLYSASPVQFFCLRVGAVECDAAGVRVGGIPLLARTVSGWRVRDDPKSALSQAYGFPVDFDSRRAGLEVVATALSAGDLAKAQTATVHMRLPDPPPPNPSTEEKARLALALAINGLLKADPDWEAEHPRTGEPPNPGWFASKPKPDTPATQIKRPSNWPPKQINVGIREWIKREGGQLVRRGAELLLEGVPHLEALMQFLESIAPDPTNEWELRIEQQVAAYFNVPKTLEELQNRPNGDTFGYERHHIVEQNESNIQKTAFFLFVLAKFGRTAIESDENIVWIPRLKHEQITARYNGPPDGDLPFRRYRDYVNTLDFASQRQIGLDELRKVGVLK